MMATVRDAILEGTQAAARLHNELGLKKAVSAGAGVDVFGALLRLETTLLFRPLDGLLGACIPGPAPGVMISTQRPLRIQRFTGAHELGHVAMHHEPSLDGEEILTRSPMGGRLDLQEVAADAFAAEFLLPRWLFEAHARRQAWNRASMADPRTVYQMALRVGASYEATTRALERHKIIDADTRMRLNAIPRRKIKEELLDGHPVDNWYPDVWLLTERDEGSTIEGQPNDLFVLKLREQTGAGYVWDVDGLRGLGFTVVRDLREIPPPTDAVGGPVIRSLTAHRDEPDCGSLCMELRRPWQKTGTPLSTFNLIYDLFGKEVGMPRAVRRQMMAA